MGTNTTDPNFVVVGEALVDILPASPSVLQPDADQVAMPGGSPANVAVTLGRLGRAPAFLTSFADDNHGLLLRNWLQSSDVSVVNVPPLSGRTSTATVFLNDDGAASYDFDLSWDLTPTFVTETLPAYLNLPTGGFLHIGSISSILAPGAVAVQQAVALAKQAGWLVSFDPNARPAITPDVAAASQQVESLVSQSDLVKVSAEDLAWYYPNANPSDAAARWLMLGAAVVIVTDGAAGATVFRACGTHLEYFSVPAVPVDVVDTIGAGDTFMGALLDGLAAAGVCNRQTLTSLPPEKLREAALWASKVAALTCGCKGANPPTRTELLAVD